MNEQEDFAAIVRASNGQQVLLYKSVEDEGGNTLNCIADFGDYQANLKVTGIPDSMFEAILLKKANVAMADKIIEQSSGF